jgi:hypothetical protein
MMPGMTLGVVASWRWLYLAAKPSHMEVYVDGLAYPLAPSCGLLLLDEGSRLLVRHSLVLSCRSIWWHLSGIAGSLGLGYLMAGYLCYELYMEYIVSYQDMFYTMAKSLWCRYAYPWSNYYSKG